MINARQVSIEDEPSNIFLFNNFFHNLFIQSLETINAIINA